MTALATAVRMFSIIPLGRTDNASDAAQALVWLPVVGAALGAVAGLPVVAIAHDACQAALVAAVLAVGVLAVLTRGLHLDGLADTADGLASHAPAERALEIMRRSDIGPFGVLAIVFVVAIDVSAVVAVSGSTWQPVAALTVAAATGRVAVVHAAHRGVPSARPVGFGALVAGSVSTAVAVIQTVLVAGFGALLAYAVDADPQEWVAAQLIALALAAGFRWHVSRRLGGVTGDVFGALLESATAITLIGIALS